ncbi:MAG: single-stranded DNA-binding protein [Chloroflexi bacterium]|nr:single-stranded DNA-binding protein [Chloroflexota bacterium]
MARTLNKVQLIGRLGADPESRFTSGGVQVVTLSLATNRQWQGKDGSLQEETDWHSIVVWDKLAQLCAEYLSKGRLIYIEGRIHTRSWESNGQKQYKTEIIASDMLILDSKNPAGEDPREDKEAALAGATASRSDKGKSSSAYAPVQPRGAKAATADYVDPDELPF